MFSSSLIMNVKEEQYCRLCLKVAENDFEIIDETTRQMFESLLLKVNLDITKDPIICKDCAEVAAKCFNFKSACIDTQKHIFSFAIYKKKATYELDDIYKDGIDVETVDDNFICRFCTNYLSGSNFVLLDTLIKDVTFAQMLQVLMPEMNLDMIKNASICASCKQDLECYIKFVENCLDVEGKITKYIQKEDTAWAQVKLSEILHFSLTNNSESNYTQIHAIKKEEDLSQDICAGKLIKTEETLDIKYEELNSNEIVGKASSDTRMYNLNIPCGLDIKIGESQKTSTEKITFTSTTVNSTMCMCGIIYHCSDKCDKQSNMIPPGTGMGKAKCKDEVNKMTNQVLNSKKISEAQILECSMCTYQATHKRGLRRHMLIHKNNTEVKMYKCSRCNFETKYNRNLVRHMLIHKDITDLKLYTCTKCAFQTKQKCYLKTHMLIHRDNKEVAMYKCSVCTYETKRKDNLKSHVLIHKNITELEMYKCSMCTYETKRKDKLKTHRLIHKNNSYMEMHKCSMCTYETNYKSSLKRHMLVHKDIAEVEMYKCSMCTYKTKHKSNLKTHVLIHKNNR